MSCLFVFWDNYCIMRLRGLGILLLDPWMMDELWMNLGLGARIPGFGIDSYFGCFFFDIALRHMGHDRGN
jgi:hypothetical protein